MPNAQRSLLAFTLIPLSALYLIGCGNQPVTTSVNLANTNSNINSNSNATSNVNSNSTASTTVETKEPDAYEATVTLKFEAIGGEQKTTLPPMNARVSRSGTDRRMEFAMPAGGRVIYLDKNGKNYLVLPEMKQYAELDKDSLGFEVRRMLMPEQIVAQAKGVQGMQLVGEEKYNGRDVVKYRYAATAETQSQAGKVNTESFLLVDKATSLPLHTETVSQSQSGGNVQGYSGLRIVTEISDINTQPATDQFAEPTAFKKIEASQIQAQVNMIFSSVAMFLGQMMKQGQPAASPGAK